MSLSSRECYRPRIARPPSTDPPRSGGAENTLSPLRLSWRQDLTAGRVSRRDRNLRRENLLRALNRALESHGLRQLLRLVEHALRRRRIATLQSLRELQSGRDVKI